MQKSVLLLCWGSYGWACNLWVLITYLFFLPVMLPFVVLEVRDIVQETGSKTIPKGKKMQKTKMAV